ncbi:hypothetical protein PTTG_27232 [Puccinia triticina 1-1 BBBD Race 1]|uniref:Uncharacterized protein n=1 Tax=Puccinia triticina (isolate 1-1 / race 1 (BBBD)) TaxID=630390 RepID=A0A180GPA3_PUCT1|nr:hypothetical protein PTTG_27232 [Puccinia triticina 1-1 BBBD Race 1]
MGISVVPIDCISQIRETDRIDQFPFMVVKPCDGENLAVYFSRSKPQADSPDVRYKRLDLGDVKAALMLESGGQQAIKALELSPNRELIVDQNLRRDNHWKNYYKSEDPIGCSQTQKIASLINAVCTHRILAAQPPIILFPVENKVMIQYPAINSDREAATFTRTEMTFTDVKLA